MTPTEFINTLDSMRKLYNEGTFLGEVGSRFVYVQFKGTKNLHLQIEDSCSVGADNLNVTEWKEELQQLIKELL